MKCIAYVLLLLIFPCVNLLAQTYSGPAEGSIPSGVVVSTDNFTRIAPVSEPIERGIRNIQRTPDDMNFIPQRLTSTEEIDNYLNDPSTIEKSTLYDTAMAVLLKNFSGIGQTNSIPPDPYIAAGPTHIMATVNSVFAIWDKEGNLVKTIDAGSWYRTAFNRASPFDPKVLYDHFDKRWIMVWLDQDDTFEYGYFLISVSDDSIPTGTWYNWALPSNQNGSTVVNNWSDYQGVGFDKNALYFSSNQFQFNGGFQYLKIRIVPKAQLYNNAAGPVNWKDIWNVYYPPGGSLNRVRDVRPVIMHSENSEYYLLHAPNFSNGSDYFVLYKITDVLTNPVLTGSLIPVNLYYPAPNANQLGGSLMLIEAGASALRNEPKYRDGFIWAVHSVRNAVSAVSSSVRYVKIDVSSLTAVEDVAMGAPNYWYFYPAVEIDMDHNMALTYSRSATTEYVGAFFNYRINTDPSGLRGSILLQKGLGNYVKDYSSGRNRWGDYNGIWLDPSDNYSMWIFTEYAAELNTWGTKTGKIRLTPFTGIYTSLSALPLNFGNVELNNDSDTLTLHVSNYGEEDLVINNIPSSEGSFRLLNTLSFPLVLSTYDTLTLSFVFNPADTGAYNVTYPVSSNDPSLNGFPFSGYSYKIMPASINTLYAVSGNGNNNTSMILNPQNGSPAVLGPVKIKDIKSIAVNPKNNIIYGVSADNYIIRLNAEKGDAYNLFHTTFTDLFAAAFDTSGQFYCARKSGEIYAVDLSARTLTLLSTAKINIHDMAFNPLSNQLWASLFLPVGTNKDRIYKIDILTGDTTLVGKTGLNISSPAITFDKNGNLYGITGSATVANSLIRIDTSTAAGSIVGSIGLKDITGLAYSNDNLTGIHEFYSEIPSEYYLKQNYPNPFNPVTVIEFSVPETADIKLNVYNLLGEIVDQIIKLDAKAGIHKFNWDASNKNISSGVYFYEITAESGTGNNFSSIRKMILMK